MSPATPRSEVRLAGLGHWHNIIVEEINIVLGTRRFLERALLKIEVLTA